MLLLFKRIIKMRWVFKHTKQMFRLEMCPLDTDAPPFKKFAYPNIRNDIFLMHKGQ